MMARAGKKYSDIKGSRDRGPKEFKTHVVYKEGDIMGVAEKNVITVSPLASIKNVATLMKENDVRRIPIIDPGTKRLTGMARAIDILDFLGGGEKYKIIEKDYEGNFLAAINAPITKIMRENPVFLDKKASVEDAVNIMLDRHSSCIPVVDNKDNLKVVALVTERDILPPAVDFGIKIKNVMQKNVITSSLGMMISDVSKIMVRNGLRRLPVVRLERLVGVVTILDILGYLERGQYKGVNAEENLSVRVEDIMEAEVVPVSPEQDLGDVCRLVRETGFGGFPVAVDDKLEGIVTTTDVFRWVYRPKKT
ncbi:MAG: CBS domain-containing protein [Candidatus Altiarchaeota archaeon]